MTTDASRTTTSYGNRWYYVVIALSLGMLSPVPFAHAAIRMRGARARLCWVWTALYTAAVVLALVLSSVASTTSALPASERPTPWGGLLILTIIVVALVHVTAVRRQVWSATRPPDEAVGVVLAARRRREEARRILARDPSMARELRIGRPDLPRTFDDGGLADLNSAPPLVIADACGIDPAIAVRIVETRRVMGMPFATVDDVFSHVEIPVDQWDRIRERAVVVR
ncbi:MAG: hypothetical protein ABW212_02130 [Pseudonocardia sediminis]